MYRLESVECRGILAGVVGDWAASPPDICLISREGHPLYTQRLLLALHSTLLPSLLQGASDALPCLSVPLPFPSMALLARLLATGLTSSTTKFDIMELVEGAEALGIDMDDLKVEKDGDKDTKEEEVPKEKVESNKRLEKNSDAEIKAIGWENSDDNDSKRTESNMKIRYPCLHCPKMFNEKDSLERHTLLHSKVQQKSEVPKVKQEPILSSCSICQKTFMSENSLKVHMQVHTQAISKGPTVHKCDSCEKSFLRAGDLKKHIIDNHTPYDQLPHVCTICEQRFKRPEYLQTHMGREHA